MSSPSDSDKDKDDFELSRKDDDMNSEEEAAHKKRISKSMKKRMSMSRATEDEETG